MVAISMHERDTQIDELIQEARGARPELLAELLDSYRSYLGLLAKIWIDGALRSKADPSDLVQESLIKAQQRFSGFHGRTEVELIAWLRRILARKLSDFARRFRETHARQISRERPLDDVLADASEALGGLLAASECNPSREAGRRELCVVLADALAELPTDSREVIVLRNLEQLDWKQVSERMDRTTDAVRMLWSRALRSLRPLIKGRL